MAAYTFSCFSIFTRSYEDEENRVLIRQNVLMFLIQAAAFGVMFLATDDMRILIICGALFIVLLAVILLYNLIYPNVSRLVVNNMCMLITAGMIMITRLSADNEAAYGSAIRQMAFVILGVIFGLVVPILIRKLTFLDRWTYIYAGVGGAALLVVAVFVNIPAQIIDSMMPEVPIFWFAVIAIFFYYICSTIFPIDKIIGKIYPLFGALLLVGTLAICVAVIAYAAKDPFVLTETAAFKEKMWTAENGHPVIPLLFVTIACGIISGFHATQSPIIARTMKSERQGRSAFYGMMIVEGVIAMIWAAAGLAIYNLFPEKMDENATWVLSDIAKYFLGEWVGSITLLGVIILAVSSGDTAMRSLRMSLAEMLDFPQKKLSKRIVLCAPLIVMVSLLLAWSNVSASTFAQLWNYFAWGNQVLAAATLSASAVWLYKQGKNGGVALVPAMFMTFIVISYILWISPEHGGPVGFGLDLNVSYAIAAILTLILASLVRRRGTTNRIKLDREK